MVTRPVSGVKDVRTPHIDLLGRDRVRFTSAYFWIVHEEPVWVNTAIRRFIREGLS
jgi:hypothetical protein